MAKGPKRGSAAAIVEEFAQRRGGANYQDAYRASKRRLRKLGEDLGTVPDSYKTYLLVGVCTCMESHIKYFYAHAAERFSSNRMLLTRLLKDVNVDIETLISTNSRSFALADVVAASISVSSLEGYRKLATHFFSALMGVEFDFPWSYEEIFTEGDPEWKKSIAERLERLRGVFEARHKFIHETSILDDGLGMDIGVDLGQAVEDALWVLGEFEKIYWDLEFNPEFGIKKQQGLHPNEIDEAEKELDERFERIKSVCSPRQHEKLEEFKIAFKNYLWSRCAFEASVFLAQQSEETMGFFLELAPQYHQSLNHLYLQQQFLSAKFPEEAQLRELGVEIEPTPPFERA